METVLNAPAEQIAEQIQAVESLRQKTIRDQEAIKQNLARDQPSAPGDQEWVMDGFARITAFMVDVNLYMEMKFNSGEILVCNGNLGGFGFCSSGSVFDAYCYVAPGQLVIKRIGFIQIAVGSGTGEMTLWQDNQLVSVILLAGIGAGAVGAAGTVTFAFKQN